MAEAPIGVTVLVSDTHVGGTTSLIAPGPITTPDGQSIIPSKLQGWLWECWTDFNQHVKRYKRRGAKIFVIVNGDETEGRHHDTYQILSEDETTHSNLAVEVFDPLLSNADGCAFIYGTEAHSGRANKLERLVAQHFENRGLVKNETGGLLHDVFKSTIFGTLFNATHHTNGGKNDRLRLSAAMLAIEAHQTQALHDKVPVADILVRSHIHHHVDTEDHYSTRMLVTGCWQLPTQHAVKIAPDRLPHIGGWFVEHYTDGHRHVEPMFYPIVLSNANYPEWQHG